MSQTIVAIGTLVTGALLAEKLARPRQAVFACAPLMRHMREYRSCRTPASR